MDIEEIRFPSHGIKIQRLWLENGILLGHKLMYGFLRVRTFRKPKKRWSSSNMEILKFYGKCFNTKSNDERISRRSCNMMKALADQ